MTKSTQPSDLEVYFLQLVNAARAEVGVAPLTFDGELLAAAGDHSDWMVARDVFSHTGAGGSSPGDRMAAAGYGASAWGENVAYIAGPGADVLDRTDVEILHANLMNSPGHRANILSTTFTEIGIGLTQGDYNGLPAVFVTEDFGAPDAAEAAEADPIRGGTGPALQATAAKPAAALTAGSGAHTLVLKIAQDAWQGDAQYAVAVDGTQVGGVFTASALRAAGGEDTVTLRGDWGAGPHKVEVTFLNDAWGGTAATDRNLYLDALSYDGVEQPVGAALYSNGTASATFGTSTTPTPDPGSSNGSGSVSLRLSEDAWQGHAQFIVSLDGVQVGGTRTAKASHASGQHDEVTLAGLAVGHHEVAVTFLNDAWGGTAATDRNLYVDSVAVNGHEVVGAEAALFKSGTATFHLDVWA